MYTNVDLLRGKDINGIAAWIYNHCRRHPLHTIPEAAHALMDELRAGR